MEARWTLQVDGVSVGSREVSVRYEGESGARVRVLEGYTALSGGVKKKERYAYEQRLTANSHEAAPASFTSAVSTDGVGREVQARFTEGRWAVSVVEASGKSKAYELPAARVDLSTVDLFDPESDRKITQLTSARILSAEIGKILEGPVRPLGPSTWIAGGESMVVDGYEWQTELGPWRFWYASNGFLVRYEVPLLGRRVSAELDGPAPRGIDEFAVGGAPPVEVEEL